jgi:hypothetical protein
MSPYEAARYWIERGFHPIPIPHRQKKPVLVGWPDLRIKPEDASKYFNGTRQNIGILLGDEYGSTDLDLDSPEAVRVASEFAPETGAVFGHRSKPQSHYLYRCDPGIPSRQFKDPTIAEEDKNMIVELRCQTEAGRIGRQTVVPPSVHKETGEAIEFAPGFDGHPANVDADQLVRAVELIAASALIARHWPKKGYRHEACLALAGWLARAGWSEKEANVFCRAVVSAAPTSAPERVRQVADNVSDTYDAIKGGRAITGYTRLAELVGHKVMACAREWLRISGCQAADDRAGTSGPSEKKAEGNFGNARPWPDPLKPEAFHGIAGELVHLIEPHSEADPAALLVQFLICFGNVIGRFAHFLAEADSHFTNLFAVIVGQTSKGRKGTSLGQIRRNFASVDSAWSRDRVMGGLSSGEGLIYAVRDQVRELKPYGRKKDCEVQYKEIITDAGVSDKRLLVTEPEFARVLQVAERESNTLSAIMRNAWDDGTLRVLTKKQAAATGAHISIIGHITKSELQRLLTDTAVSNGFANRFLWICARRSKLLPEGDALHKVDFGPIQSEIQKAVIFARGVGCFRRNDEATAIWRDVYPALSEGKPGIFGSVTSRAEAQTMRLACLYALLDRSPIIKAEHLTAALGVWQYSEASARFIFGDALGDPTADEILRALRSRAEGMTRTEIRELFQRNKPSAEIQRALSVLLEYGLAAMTSSRESEDQNRPTERWKAVTV